MKLKNIFLALYDQLTRPGAFKNFFITGNAWGIFSINSHINKHTGKEKIMYKTRAGALKSAQKMSEKKGVHFSVYKCMYCDGYHLGKNQQNKVEGYDYIRAEPYLEYTRKENEWKEDKSDVPCWSLAALLSVLPKKYYPIKDHETNLILGKPKDKWCALYWDTTGMQDGEQTLGDSPIDACYEMILKLHELKVL